jgi:uncharacterized coiled-coil protein SlyX
LTKKDILRGFTKNTIESLRLEIERKREELDALEEKLAKLEESNGEADNS